MACGVLCNMLSTMDRRAFVFRSIVSQVGTGRCEVDIASGAVNGRATEHRRHINRRCYDHVVNHRTAAVREANSKHPPRPKQEPHKEKEGKAVTPPHGSSDSPARVLRVGEAVPAAEGGVKGELGCEDKAGHNEVNWDGGDLTDVEVVKPCNTDGGGGGGGGESGRVRIGRDGAKNVLAGELTLNIFKQLTNYYHGHWNGRQQQNQANSETWAAEKQQ